MTERKVLKLLPEAEVNLKKLEDLINEEIKKLLSLGTKWDKHRGPLVEQYRELRSNSTHMVSKRCFCYRTGKKTNFL
jgi:Protein of unknown function (DUF812)